MGKLKYVAFIFVFMSAQALAEDLPDQEIAPEHLETTAVVQRADLATKLGLTDRDALFGSPRDFRENQLNEMTLEPLQPDGKQN